MANYLNLMRQRLLSSAVLMALLFVVLIASLYVLGTIALQLERFGQYYHWLLVGNGLALCFIAVLIFMNGWRLVKEFRARIAGSRLTVKLVIVSVLLALVPVTLVYGFSIRFLRANINSYFDLEIEKALDDALELSRESLELQMSMLQRDTVKIADQLVGVSESVAVVELNTLTSETEASEMTLIGPDNRIIASTGLLDSISVQPNRPENDLISRAQQGLSYVGVDPVGRNELYIRVRYTGVFRRCEQRKFGIAGSVSYRRSFRRSCRKRAVQLPAVSSTYFFTQSADAQLYADLVAGFAIVGHDGHLVCLVRRQTHDGAYP